MAVSADDSLEVISTDAGSNTAVVRYRVWCYTSGESYNLNEQTGYFTIDGEEYWDSYTLPKNSETKVFDDTKTIYNASGKYIEATYEFPTTPAGGTKSGGSGITIPNIPRYATVSASLASKSYNSATINWSTDANVDHIRYKINSGSWVDAETYIDKRSGSFTIPNLSPNTSYTITVNAKRKDSQLWSADGGKAATVSVTTYDYGKISSVSNFNHGDNASVVVTNPSGATLSLKMKIGTTEILTTTATAGTNTISFTQSQLDQIYRLYGSSNTQTATFVLSTGTYTDSKNATITLTGNQKTVHVSQGRARVYVGVNGTVKPAVVWVGNNGNRRCI